MVIPIVIGAVLVLALVLWLILGKGPRLARALKQVETLVQSGNWREGLKIVEGYQSQSLSAVWKPRVDQAQGMCLRASAEESFREKRYEEGLATYLRAAPYLGIDETEARRRTQSVMLGEVRALFASLAMQQLDAGNATLQRFQELNQRVEAVLPNCPEVPFWQGLIQIRLGNAEEAMRLLQHSHELGQNQTIDTLFYIAALQYGQNQPDQALKTLSEANRIDSRCVLIMWLMGRAMSLAGNDPTMATRVLQRAMGAQGLGLWQQRPERVWVEAFPDGRAYVRKLAEAHQYTCPIFGVGLATISRLGYLALAQSLYRQEDFEAAAKLFAKLMEDKAPALPELRGLGLSLARLNRYDEAFKHLRAALEMAPNDAQLTGYLAVCGACGRTKNPEDKPKNVSWAFRQFARLQILHDPEWAGLQLKVHSEARQHNIDISPEDQARVCDALASAHLTTADAASAYDYYAVTCPDQVQAAHAWHYCEAAHQHGFQGEADLKLFEMAFQNREVMERFFQQQQWSVPEVEYLYLARFAQTSPGRFPPVLGEDYASRGEPLLLTRSKEQEKSGNDDGALEAVDVLLKLNPRSIVGHDRLACLHFRKGEKERALELLASLQSLAPNDPVPFVRRAVIEHQQSNFDECNQQIRRALELSQGNRKAEIAWLGARLALTRMQDSDHETISTESEEYLRVCLQANPDHPDALCILASAMALRGDRDGLKSLLPQMGRVEVLSSRYHYLSSLCFLCAGDYQKAIELADRAGLDDQLTVECQYLKAWAYLHQGLKDEATQALQPVAKSKSPVSNHARGLLGSLAYEKGNHLDAVKWWSLIDQSNREKWQLDNPLRLTVFLTGLTAMNRGRYEQAAERFREAGRLGLREPTLGSLIRLALFREGRRLFYQNQKQNGTV